tara:strand:- start:634 stop:810 length:177 start_codon:yes stop_codon:yes gene_type:complete
MALEEIFEKIENLIDDIERDKDITKALTLETLYKIKEDIEQLQLDQNEHSINWEDLDN